jgi:hypothetical protein
LKTLLVVGLILLAASVVPLWQMARELVIGAQVERRYRVQDIPPPGRGMVASGLAADLNGHRVQLLDDVPATDERTARVDSRVRIVIGGREYGTDSRVVVRPAFTDANRYWGFVYLMRLTDHQRGRQFLVVAQNVGAMQYRVLWIDEGGRVSEERFGYGERCSPPVRARVIRYVTPHPSGYCSDVLQVWPSLFYPILYPWLSGALGAVLAAVAAAVLSRHGKRRVA